MREAAGQLVGDHDFRNFCKADVGHVHSFRRTILAAGLAAGPGPGPGAPRRRVLQLTLRGTAFLWHQARCRRPSATSPSAAYY